MATTDRMMTREEACELLSRELSTGQRLSLSVDAAGDMLSRELHSVFGGYWESSVRELVARMIRLRHVAPLI